MRILSVVTIAVLCAPALAQSSAEVNAGIQFNFASPGARSLARGGAFIADANDATAAYANPAGLVNLPGRELSLEVRSSEYVNTYTDHGHAFGPPSFRGEDKFEGIRTGTSENTIRNIAFASVVLPFRSWTFAAYRHELANFEASARTQGAFFTLRDPISGTPVPLRHYPAVSALRLRVVGIGAAAAWRVGSRMSLGLGLRRYSSEIVSTTERYSVADFYGPATYEVLNNTQEQRGRGSALGFNAGFLFDVNRHLSVGGSYRQGFSFPVTITYVQGNTPRPPRTARFNVPSFYGLGLSVRPTDNWSVALDMNRITYSDMARDFVLLFQEEPQYHVPDGTEIRLGSEFVLTRDLHEKLARLPFPIALYVGGWRDPDHSVRVADIPDSQSVLFRAGSDDYHVSFGVGVILQTRAQLHAAIDRSSRQTTMSISAMARF